MTWNFHPYLLLRYLYSGNIKANIEKQMVTSGYNLRGLQLLSLLHWRRTSLRDFAAAGSWGSLLVFCSRNFHCKRIRRVVLVFQNKVALGVTISRGGKKSWIEFFFLPFVILFFIAFLSDKGEKRYKIRSEQKSKRHSKVSFLVIQTAKKLIRLELR